MILRCEKMRKPKQIFSYNHKGSNFNLHSYTEILTVVSLLLKLPIFKKDTKTQVML